jgi:CheY-like chemotaxis protein
MSHSEPLTTLIAGAPLPVEEVVRLGKEIAEAVARGGIHGELWPSAISVSDDGVGILPPADTDRARYGQYAAPERLLGKPPTSASDVFSIGAILFHAISGRPPFQGDSPAKMMLAALSEEPINLPLSVPGEVAAVLRRCLSRQPDARYATPAVLRDALAAITPASPVGQFPGRRVLVADDEPDLRDAYAGLLKRMGIAMDVVGSGREAIESMKGYRYDVALLDLHMPRLSGWEVLDFLRTRPERRPQRIFVVTGFADQKISGADQDLVSAVIYKPVPPEELRALLTGSLSGGPFQVQDALRTAKYIAYA